MGTVPVRESVLKVATPDLLGVSTCEHPHVVFLLRCAPDSRGSMKQGQESIVCMETASDCAREGRKMELMEARAPR